MMASRTAYAIGYMMASLGALLLAAAGAELAAILLQFGAFLLYFAGEVRLRAGGVVHLDLIFLAFFLVYALCVPLYAQFGGKDLAPAVVSEALVVCLLANLGYAFGAVFATTLPAQQTMQEAPPTARRLRLDPTQVVRAGYIVFAVGLVLSIVAVLATVGFDAYLSAGYAGRALLKRENGPIEIGLYVCVSAIVAIYAATLMSGQKTTRSNLFVYACIVLFIGYTAFLGIRRPMFLLILGVFSAYSLIMRRPTLGRAALLMLPIALLLSTFAQYRQIISTAGVSEAVTFVQDNANADWLDLSNNELGAPFRTLYDTIAHERPGERQYGLSYLQAPLYMLPSSVGLKVESLSVQYTNRFFDQAFLDIGGNMGFFPATEAYVNFGYLGCLGIFALYAVVLRRLNGFFQARARSDAMLVASFAILVPWMAFFIRLDFASFMKGFFYSQVTALLLILVLARWMPGRRGMVIG